MTEDEYDALVSQVRNDLQPKLRRGLNTIDFKELDNQTKPAQYGHLPIVLIYLDFYFWLAANTDKVQPGTDFQTARQLFRIDRDAFLGRGTAKSVTDQLEKVKNNAPGRALMDAIGAQSRKISVVPDFYSQATKNSDVGGSPVSLEDATYVGMPILWAGRNAAEHGEDPWPSALSHPTKGGGFGRGSDYTLNYSPELYGPRGVLRETYPGSEPDQTLFHELVHALRNVMGLVYFAPINQHYDNEEEYLAIVLTNIYMSAQGTVTLRADHYDGILRDPDHFLDNVQRVDVEPRMLLERFKLNQRKFFDALAGIKSRPPRFNPVREYDDEVNAGSSANGQKVKP